LFSYYKQKLIMLKKKDASLTLLKDKTNSEMNTPAEVDIINQEPVSIS